MLTREENELITRVENDAPAGRMMRRYWLPALLSDEVARPGAAPVPIRLVGERLLAFRERGGELRMVDANDPARSYPTRIGGGLVWSYIGPPELEPPFPAMDWTSLPREQLAPVRFVENTNWLQAFEGSIDTAHSWFLHRGTVGDWKARTSVSLDFSPRLECEDTPYGFRYASIRRPLDDPDTKKYVRVSNVVFPAGTLVPRQMDPRANSIIQIFIPMDDTHVMHYSVWWSVTGEPLDERTIIEDMRCVPGVHIDSDFNLDSVEDNWWKQDRVAMKDGSYTGIMGFPRQDVACQESMGAIVDRTREHLGTSDIAIIRMRRRMLDNIRGVMAGRPAIGVDASIDWPHLRSEQRVIGVDEPWQKVGAFAGEFAAAR